MRPTFPNLQRVEGVSGGGPCLKGTGILAEFVADRFLAGESIARIAQDYRDVTEAMVVDAIRLALYLRGGTNLLTGRALRKLEHVLPLGK